MPSVNINDIAINYYEEGTGFPLVLIHGLSDNWTLWKPLIPGFSDRYRVIAIDIRGHGDSGKPDTDYSIKLFSKDLHDFLDMLKIRQAHLMGFSMGGSIAQQFTLDYPQKVGSLILLSSFYKCNSDLRQKFAMLKKAIVENGMEGFFDQAIKLVISPDFAAAHAKDLAVMRDLCAKTNSPAAIANTLDACAEFDVSDRISQVTKPTLIISGSEDAFVPSYLAEDLHKAIKGSVWHNLEGSWHNLLIPEQIPELTRIITEFLERPSH
jgi:3-oxoadipate enol-lactonase